jgi:hypothetical protein
MAARTTLVQTAGIGRMWLRERRIGGDFHKLFHSSCEHRETTNGSVT